MVRKSGSKVRTPRRVWCKEAFISRCVCARAQLLNASYRWQSSLDIQETQCFSPWGWAIQVLLDVSSHQVRNSPQLPSHRMTWNCAHGPLFQLWTSSRRYIFYLSVQVLKTGITSVSLYPAAGWNDDLGFWNGVRSKGWDAGHESIFFQVFFLSVLQNSLES